MFKIRDKILVTFLSVVIIPLIITITFFGIYTTKSLKRDKTETFRQATNSKAERADYFIQNIIGDIKSLSNNQLLLNLIDAMVREDKEQIDRWKFDVGMLFKTYSENRGIYYQIRYIDDSGHERVRVDMGKEYAFILSSEKLQNEGHKDYYKETIKLKDGSIYVSQPNSNKEQGEIKGHNKPMLTYALPVFDDERQKKGILLLNVSVENLFQKILMHDYLKTVDSYLVNKDGLYILQPDQTKQSNPSKNVSMPENLNNVFPEKTATLFLSGQSGIRSVDKYFYNFVPIYFDPSNNERYWVLLERLPASKVYSSIYTFYIIFGVLTLILIAAVVTTAFIFSKKLTRPLNELVKGVTIVAKAEWDLNYHIPVTSNDETAFLTFSFNKMIYRLGKAKRQLQTYADNLERKIEDKTKEVVGKARQQEVVAEIGNILWTDLDIQDAMDKVVDSAHKTLEVEFCGIFMLDKSQRFLRLASGIGWKEGLIGHATVEVGPDSQIGLTYSELRPVMIKDIGTEARLSLPPLLEDHGIVSGLSVPMVVGNNAVGVMGIHTTKTGVFSKDDENFLQSVGHIIAAAIERRRSEEEIIRRKEYTENLIETAQDAIVSIDENGIVNVWNQSAKKIFGYSKNEIIEKPLTTIFPLNVLQELLRVSKANTIGKTIEVSGRTKEGNEIPIEISLSSQDIGNNKFTFTMIIRDITFQKEAKKQLIERSEQLQTLNRELEDFVYIVSHDLKEPLFAIEGISSRLSMIYKDVFDAKGNQYISRIKVNIELMSQKINEIMDVLKIGRVKYVFKDIDSKVIVEDVVKNCESKISDNKIDVSIQDDLPVVPCDEKRLKDVFANLISNAIKFIGNDSLKKIRIGCLKNDEYYKFFVEDTGIGIRPEYHETVFKIFRRLNDIEVEGTGVGLAIVKKIVELHNGKVWVESPIVNGRGAKILFTLPASR